MQEFLVTESCRRMEILRYFDTKTPELPVEESCCDNCLKKLNSLVPLHEMYEDINKNGMLDISDDARDTLSLIKAYKGRCVENDFLNVLLGLIPSTCNRHHPLELFGKGKSKPKEWWMKIVKILFARKMIRKRIEVRNIPVANANIDENDGEVVEMIVRRDDFISLTYRGSKFLRRKMSTFLVRPSKDILPLLRRTNLQFFIENGVVRSKPRETISPKKIESKISEKKTESSKLFDFKMPANAKKPTRNVNEENVNAGAGCSTWKTAPLEAEITETDLELMEDENLEAMKSVYLSTRRSMSVEIDELLAYLENYRSEEMQHEGFDSSELQLSIEIEGLASDPHRVDDIRSMSKKRLGSVIDIEAETPAKLCR